MTQQQGITPHNYITASALTLAHEHSPTNTRPLTLAHDQPTELQRVLASDQHVLQLVVLPTWFQKLQRAWSLRCVQRNSRCLQRSSNMPCFYMLRRWGGWEREAMLGYVCRLCTTFYSRHHSRHQALRMTAIGRLLMAVTRLGTDVTCCCRRGRIAVPLLVHSFAATPTNNSRFYRPSVAWHNSMNRYCNFLGMGLSVCVCVCVRALCYFFLSRLSPSCACMYWRSGTARQGNDADGAKPLWCAFLFFSSLHTLSHQHTHTLSFSLSLSLFLSFSVSHTHTHTETHKSKNTYTHTHTQDGGNRRQCVCTQTHTHIHLRTPTHTHPPTHTHAG